MQSLTKEEATLFMDGQTHYLQQVLRIVMSGDCPCIQSVLKSGGNCSGFQQLLDAIRGFMALRKRLTGPDFWKVLEIPILIPDFWRYFNSYSLAWSLQQCDPIICSTKYCGNGSLPYGPTSNC